jgi:hypothetical protein
MMNNRNNNKDNKGAALKDFKIYYLLPESILAESRGEVLKPETTLQNPQTRV